MFGPIAFHKYKKVFCGGGGKGEERMLTKLGRRVNIHRKEVSSGRSDKYHKQPEGGGRRKRLAAPTKPILIQWAEGSAGEKVARTSLTLSFREEKELRCWREFEPGSATPSRSG